MGMFRFTAIFFVVEWAAAQAASNPELIARGAKLFEVRCGLCHGADGTGGERGPDISQHRSDRVQTEKDLRQFIRTGSPEAGMPASPLPEDQLAPLVAFVRSLTAAAS